MESANLYQILSYFSGAELVPRTQNSCAQYNVQLLLHCLLFNMYLRNVGVSAYNSSVKFQGTEIVQVIFNGEVLFRHKYNHDLNLKRSN